MSDRVLTITVRQRGGGVDFATGTSFEVCVEQELMAYYASPAQVHGIVDAQLRELSGHNEDGSKIVR